MSKMADVDSLLEREKELRCLYRVQQFTLNLSLPLETVFQEVVEAIGPGWQRPETAGACIEYFGRSYRSANYSPSVPGLAEVLKLGSQEIGRILVSDSCPDFEAGASNVFLPEERQLLKSIADLLSNFLEWRHLEVLGRRLSIPQSHWRWRERLVLGMVERFEEQRFGFTEFYLGGGTGLERATHGSDIDLFLYHDGTEEQKEDLKLWLEGWSLSIAEMSKVQTGELFPDGILHLHWLETQPDQERYPELRKLGGTCDGGKESSDRWKSRKSNAEVEEMIQRTLLGLSHELRNPLTVISADLDLLRAKLPSKERGEIISEIQQAVSRISVLVTNLMLFLRAETGIEKPMLEEVEIGAFLRSVVSSYNDCMSPTEVIFLSDKEASKLKVRMSRKLTERILRDLIDNAVRYSKSEQIKVSLSTIESDLVVVTVKDEGCGIDEIHHDKLFEQFYRLESSRDRLSGGVGLGLPLARALAKSQNSLLELTSHPGEGTEVRLIFQRI